MTRFDQSYTGPLAVAYDLDGVLVASEAEWARLFCEIVRELGYELSEDDLASLYGSSEAYENEVLARVTGRTVDEMARIKSAYISAHPVDYASILIEGVRDSLSRLHALGLSVAIATSSPIEGAQRMMKECGLTDVFDAVATSSDVERPKPEPDIYLRAAELLGVDPARCVAVDDSSYGIEAALRAGMHAVHFAASADAPDLTGVVDDVCYSHAEVLELVEQLISEGLGAD